MSETAEILPEVLPNLPTTSPRDHFSADHRLCDGLWAAVEAAANEGDKARALASFAGFAARTRRHFAMEEEVLFPAVEDATGMHGGGPTQVMRAEHIQIRNVLDQMATAAAASDLESVLDHGDTLLMLSQQHNVKEEGILYPMADQALGASWGQLVDRVVGFVG